MVLRSTAATTSELLPPPRPSTVPCREDEFELLCELSGAKLSPERQQHIANWNLSTLDWNEFLRLAEHHGVLPLAAVNLFKYRSAASRRELPPDIERSLRSAYDVNLRRSLWFTAELARIMQHFEQRQLRAIPYKGPSLAQSLYRDVGLRSFSDLDFLIPPTDFEQAKQALAEIGYRPSADLAPAIERLWLRIGYERSFDGAAGKNLVELQWALLPHFYAIDLRGNDMRVNDLRVNDLRVNDLRIKDSRAASLSVEDLLERAGRAVIGGCKVPSLSPEDSLLVLCLHAAKHLWTRLIWLSDIAETLSINGAPGVPARLERSPTLEPVSRDAPAATNATIDYTLVLTRARELGITRILGISFWLVKNVLHRELPEPIAKMIATDPEVAALGSEFAQRLERSPAYDFESTEYFRCIMKLRERRADRWRYLWRLVWTPGVGDIAAIQLPETLFPLYRIVRIGRLARRLIW
jgi:hypothetical protein